LPEDAPTKFLHLARQKKLKKGREIETQSIKIFKKIWNNTTIVFKNKVKTRFEKHSTH
jgi:hypothetical protein